MVKKKHSKGEMESKSKRLGGPQIIHQINLKMLNVMFLAVNYYSVQEKS